MTEYHIIREIGKGGMGSVYEAISPSGQKVAIKKLDCKYAGNQEYRSFFDSEVCSLKSMHNPSVVGIVGSSFSDESGNLYLPMEYIEGKTIEQYVRSNGPFTETDAILYFSKILEAFSYIHECDCIHRDIKPSNIMIRPDGSICIIDFGIAKDLKTHTGQTIGRIVGTDGYMSPEQAKGDSVDSRTDIYSLGCLLFYMLSGKHAIVKKSNDYETVKSILSSEFPKITEVEPTVSLFIEKIILKAVNKNMLYRFQTVEEFKDAINAASTPPTEVLPRLYVSVGRNPSCDIVYPPQYSYISGIHLEIEYIGKKDPSSGQSELLIIDKSTNGTSVEGVRLHHDSKKVRCFQNIGQMPAIYLAGRSEGELDWKKVREKLQEKGAWLSATPEPQQVGTTITTPQKGKGCFGILLLLLLILPFALLLL